jgi:hypothetical protein
VRTLDAEERGHGPVRPARLDLVGSPYEAEGAWSRRHLLIEDVDLLVNGARHSTWPVREREGHQAEELGSHAAFAHPWEIEVPRKCGEGQWRLMCLVHVVPEPARPHERVGVQVDRRVCCVNRTCGIRASAPAGLAHTVSHPPQGVAECARRRGASGTSKNAMKREGA